MEAKNFIHRFSFTRNRTAGPTDRHAENGNETCNVFTV